MPNFKYNYLSPAFYVSSAWYKCSKNSAKNLKNFLIFFAKVVDYG